MGGTHILPQKGVVVCPTDFARAMLAPGGRLPRRAACGTMIGLYTLISWRRPTHGRSRPGPGRPPDCSDDAGDAARRLAYPLGPRMVSAVPTLPHQARSADRPAAGHP